MTQTLGIVGSLSVTSIDVDTLPALIIIMRSRSTTEIYTIVHGNVGVNELLTDLIQVVDIFQVCVAIHFCCQKNLFCLLCMSRFTKLWDIRKV